VALFLQYILLQLFSLTDIFILTYRNISFRFAKEEENKNYTHLTKEIFRERQEINI